MECLSPYTQSKRVHHANAPRVWVEKSLSHRGYRKMKGLTLLTLGRSRGFRNEYRAGFIRLVDYINSCILSFTPSHIQKNSFLFLISILTLSPLPKMVSTIFCCHLFLQHCNAFTILQSSGLESKTGPVVLVYYPSTDLLQLD